MMAWRRSTAATKASVALALAVAAISSSTFWRNRSCGFVTAGPARTGVAHHDLALNQGGVATVAASSCSASVEGTASPLATMAAAAALLLAGCRKCASSAPSKSSRVVMQARNPFPEAPASQRNKRRTAAGTRAFFKGRQLSVRVNKKTNKAITFKMHVRTGDTVQVMKGKDAGKVTTVLKIYKKWNRVLCLGVNFCIKHVRPQREDQVGQRVQVEAAMHSSNVMHYSEKENAVGNLGYRYEEIEGKTRKVRYNKATGETIEDKKAPEWVPVLERTSA